MLVATLQAASCQRQRITFIDECYLLEGHGRIGAADVLEYERLGQLEWASPGIQSWLVVKAAAERAGVIARLVESGAQRSRALRFTEAGFLLEAHGAITPQEIMGYDRLGQLQWRDQGTRAWVGSKARAAEAPQTATVGQRAHGIWQLASGWLRRELIEPSLAALGKVMHGQAT